MPRLRALLRTSLAACAGLALLGAGPAAFAQDDDGPDPVEPAPNPAKPPPSQPPSIGRAGTIDINYVDQDLMTLVEYFARATGKNFILGDTRELQSKKVTILSNRPVTPDAAYEAFLSALAIHGLTTVKVGSTYKIIQAQEAQQSPGAITQGGGIAATDNYVTQIIQLENVSVSDVREIIDNLVSPNAKVLAYAPSNSLILTDSGNNLRRIYKLVTELDIAAPRSSLQIYTVVYANASEVRELIQELYPPAEESQDDDRGRRSRTSRSRRTSRDPTPDSSGVTAGEQSQYISKVLADERTNTLIALANDQGHEAIADLIEKIDIDVDPTSRSQIYVYRLEHAKAEDVAGVLRDLSQEGGGSRGGQQRDRSAIAQAQARARAQEAGGEGEEAPGGAVAAFENGLRIAPDENTNALVIIAGKDDYAVIESVIRQLDVKRKQVFVDAVILEISSQDQTDLGLGYHAPYTVGSEGGYGFVSSQFGASSLGPPVNQNGLALNGLNFGIFGDNLEVPILNPLTGTTETIGIPKFGIALEALKTSQLVNIVSTPSILALDNEDAKIVVGRKVPFPTSNGFSGLGQPIISFQREDVAITLEITPRINSENFVTLELKIEVQEIEGSTDNIDVNSGGPITSKREIETTALIGDNQTMVLGGLVNNTDSESESKIPILGDLPILGALFRSRSVSSRRTNLMVFLTPHIIDDDADMEEVMRVKEAQRQEFMRRFYGKSQDAQFEEIRRLLQYSMNVIDQPSVFRGPTTISSTEMLDGEPISLEAREELQTTLDARQGQGTPGGRAGRLPQGEVDVSLPDTPDLPEDTGEEADTSDTSDTSDGGEPMDEGSDTDLLEE